MKLNNFFLKAFNSAGLKLKLFVLIDAVLLVVFVFMSIYVYQRQKQLLMETVDEQMRLNAHMLENVIVSININENGENNYIFQSIEEELREIQFNKHKGSISYSVKRENVFDKLEEQLTLIFQNIYNSAVTNIFGNIHYYNSGFPVIIHKSGKLLYHPARTNSTVTDKLFFIKMISSEELEGKIEYLWPESKDGEKMLLYYVYNPELESYIGATVFKKDVLSVATKSGNRLIILVSFVFILFSVIIYLIVGKILSKVGLLSQRIEALILGKKYEPFDYAQNDEIKQISKAAEKISEGIIKTSEFVQRIGKGELDAEFKSRSQEDVLGNALLEMRESLKHNSAEEQKRKLEDERRSWKNQGLTQFNDTLRKQSSLRALGEDIVYNIAAYLNIELCGLFIIEEKEDDNYITLLASYAYDRKKHVKKQLDSDEGLISASIREKRTIYLKKVPDGYVEITSGLGKATPKEVLIAPLREEEKIFGAIEIASIRELKQYEIEFVETVAGIIASTIATAKITEQTNHLLEQSKVQSEELASREEELRQNMEEMAATQEESQRRENTLMKQVETLERELKELKNKYEKDSNSDTTD